MSTLTSSFTVAVPLVAVFMPLCAAATPLSGHAGASDSWAPNRKTNAEVSFHVSADGSGIRGDAYNDDYLVQSASDYYDYVDYGNEDYDGGSLGAAGAPWKPGQGSPWPGGEAGAKPGTFERNHFKDAVASARRKSPGIKIPGLDSLGQSASDYYDYVGYGNEDYDDGSLGAAATPKLAPREPSTKKAPAATPKSKSKGTGGQSEEGKMYKTNATKQFRTTDMS